MKLDGEEGVQASGEVRVTVQLESVCSGVPGAEVRRARGGREAGIQQERERNDGLKQLRWDHSSGEVAWVMSKTETAENTTKDESEGGGGGGGVTQGLWRKTKRTQLRIMASPRATGDAHSAIFSFQSRLWRQRSLGPVVCRRQDDHVTSHPWNHVLP